MCECMYMYICILMYIYAHVCMSFYIYIYIYKQFWLNKMETIIDLKIFFLSNVLIFLLMLQF